MSKLISFSRFTWTLRTAGGSIHSPRWQESWSYNRKCFRPFVFRPLSYFLSPLPYLKGLPSVSLLNLSPLLSKLNYTLPFLFLTLLFHRKKGRSLPDLFLNLCPWPTASLPVLPTTACLARSSFVPSISAPSLTFNSLQKCSRPPLSKDLSFSQAYFISKLFPFPSIFKLPKILLSFSNSCI